MRTKRETWIWALAIVFAVVGIYFVLAISIWPSGIIGQWQLEPIKKYYNEAFFNHLVLHRGVLIFHVSTALLMLLIGPFQFNSSIRNRNLKRHRILGYCYLFLGTSSILSILPITNSSLGGFVTQAAAYTIAVFFFVTFAAAIRWIRRKNTQRHEVWMLRNFFVAAATFFIRPVYVILAVLFPSVSNDQLFPVSFWLCLVISLTICHWVVESSQSRSN